MTNDTPYPWSELTPVELNRLKFGDIALPEVNGKMIEGMSKWLASKKIRLVRVNARADRVLAEVPVSWLDLPAQGHPLHKEIIVFHWLEPDSSAKEIISFVGTDETSGTVLYQQWERLEVAAGVTRWFGVDLLPWRLSEDEFSSIVRQSIEGGVIDRAQFLSKSIALLGAMTRKGSTATDLVAGSGVRGQTTLGRLHNVYVYNINVDCLAQYGEE